MANANDKDKDAATVNPGRSEHKNPTDTTQANKATDHRALNADEAPNTPAPSLAEATNREGNNDVQTAENQEVPSLKEQKEILPMPAQATESVWLYFPTATTVDGIVYGSGEVKVAEENVAKLKKAGATEIKDIRNQHLGAKPMPKELDGPDYV